MTASLLEVRDVSLAFPGGSNPVLDGLTFRIAPGETYGLLGPNGSGKTTAINVFCGLLRPARGAVLFDGVPASAATRRRVGVAAQEVAIYENLTCAENLCFFGALNGIPAQALRRRADECLATVGLGDQARVLAGMLSGGQQRRLHLAIALQHGPALLVLDEPTVGLDVEARFQVWALVRELARSGMTVLLTTHLLDEAEQLCSRIGIMKRGRLVAEGSLASLRARIPAAAVALLDVGPEDVPSVARRATELGLTRRLYGDQPAIWLPGIQPLGEVARWFADAGIALRSLAVRAVGLEDVYLELSRDPNADLAGVHPPVFAPREPVAA